MPEPRGWAWQFNGFTLYEAGRWQARWSYMEGVRYVSEDVAKLARKVLGLNPQETIIVEVVHGRS